jgi:hypothetical protein
MNRCWYQSTPLSLPEFRIDVAIPAYFVTDRLEFIITPSAKQVIQFIIFPREMLFFTKPQARFNKLNS